MNTRYSATAEGLRDERRCRVAEYRLKGFERQEIATRMGCSVSTVDADIRAIKQDWKAAQRQSFEAIRHREVCRTELLMSQAWRSFELSKTKKRPEGDPRWLTLIARLQITMLRIESADADNWTVPTDDPEPLNNTGDRGATVVAELGRVIRAKLLPAGGGDVGAAAGAN